MQTYAIGQKRIRVALIALSILGLSSHQAEAIVTSDAHGTHLTTPGVPAFGVNVDGVVSLQDSFGSFCTGSLISDTHVLTAAHCVFSFDIQASFDLAGGSTAIDVTGITIHPDWNDNALDGNDIAVLELATPAPAAAPRYGLFTGSDEFLETSIKVGYGTTGFGGTGGDVHDGMKRAGLNLYDATLGELALLKGDFTLPDGDTILIFDFDNGLPANDYFGSLGLPDLGFVDDEVGSAQGDSGGPTFIFESGMYRVAGVTSFGLFGSLETDFDGLQNDGWGELGGDTRVSSFISFVDDAVAGVIEPARLVILNDGQTHTLDTMTSDVFRVENAPDLSHTTLHVVAGGSLGDKNFGGVTALGDSVVNITGGTVRNDIIARDNAEVDVSGGMIDGSIEAGDQSFVSISDGIIDAGSAMFFSDAAVHVSGAAAHITGGTIRGDFNAISATAGATVQIDGGTISAEGFAGAGVTAFEENTTVTITGGVISALIGVAARGDGSIDIFGGTILGDTLDLESSGTGSMIRVFGQNFSEPLGPLTAETGSFTGEYFDGTAFDFTFDRSFGGTIMLVPEPATLALAIACFASLFVSCRQRHMNSDCPFGSEASISGPTMGWTPLAGHDSTGRRC